MLEGKLYNQIGKCHGIAEHHWSGAVQFDKEDDTTSTIRCSIVPNGPPLDMCARQVSTPCSSAATTSYENIEPSNNTNVDSLPRAVDTANRPPQIRVHSRLVLKTFGRSIDYAKSRLELVGAMRDAIEGMVLFALLLLLAIIKLFGRP